MTDPSKEPGARRGKRAPPDRQRAWDYLLNVLSRQAYTVAELRRKLARREVPAPLAEELLARLQELNLVNDESFAEQYVTARRAARGRLALKNDLRRKGVSEEIVESEVAGLDGAQQLAAALALLEKNAWRYRPADQTGPAEGADEIEAVAERRKAAARAKAFLARRGFTPDVVVSAVERVGWFEY